MVLFHVPNFSSKAGLPYFNDWPIFNRGTEAVIFFFCLSGFLITHLMKEEIAAKSRVKVRNFYARRLLRIYPVYYLVIAIGVLLYHGILPLVSEDVGATSLIEYDLKYVLLYFILMVPNLVPYYLPGVFGILWSIGIEEQFYVFWPHLMNWFKKSILPVCFLFFVIYFSVCFFTDIGRSFLVTKGMWFHFFAAGALFSCFNEYRCSQFAKIIFSAQFQMLMLLMMATFICTDYFVFESTPVNHLFQGIFFSLFIFVFSLSQHKIFSVSSGFLNYLGKISYGIYMYHAIVINCMGGIFMLYVSKYVFEDLSVILFMNISVFFGTIALSAMSYSFYEKYFLDKSRHFR